METGLLIRLVVGLVLLIAGAEALIRGSARLGRAAGLSPVVIGLTIIAFATSSPELAVAIRSAFAGQADIALGNVVGSNIANILLILGLSALITPLVVAQQLIRLDLPLMVGLSFLLLLLGADGRIGRGDGVILAGLCVAYVAFAVIQSRRETRAIEAEYAEEYGARPRTSGAILLQLAFIVVGLGGLVLGSQWLVDGAIAIAQLLGVSELIIGLTIVAIGTSLPEVAASIIASLRQERDIVVGNVVGSNIFNLLAVLGFTAVVAPNGIEVPDVALRVDIPVMIGAALACLPIFFTYGHITRGEGLLFLSGYLLYLLYLILNATQSALLAAFNPLMTFVILPLFVIVIAARAWHSWQISRRRGASSAD